jgi:hypothetical protein
VRTDQMGRIHSVSVWRMGTKRHGADGDVEESYAEPVEQLPSPPTGATTPRSGSCPIDRALRSARGAGRSW